MTYLTEPRHVRRDFVVLMIINSLYPAIQGLVVTLLPLRTAQLGLDKTTMGLIQAVPGILVLLFGAPIARLANSRWRRATLATGFGAVLLAALLYGRVTGATGFILPQLGFGLASCIFWSNMLATAFRLAEGAEQHRIQGYITAMQSVGLCGGPLLGGYLSRMGYAYGFDAAAVLALLGLLATTRLSPSRAVEPSRGLLRDWGEAYVRLFRVMTRRPATILAIALVFMACFLIYVMGGSFYLLYASQLGFSALAASALISTRDLIGALIRLQFGRISRHIRLSTLVSGGIVLASLLLALLPLARTALGLGLIVVGVGTALACMSPAVNVLAGASAGPAEQSFGIVSTNVSAFASQTLLAPILGVLLSTYGYRATYPLVGICWAVLALVVLRLGQRIVQRQDAPAGAAAQDLCQTSDSPVKEEAVS